MNEGAELKHGVTIDLSKVCNSMGVTCLRSRQIENSLMSARNVGSTAHMSSFTDRRTIKNCLMSARNMRAAAHAPCSQRALSMFTAQILNAKSTDFTLFTDRWRRWRWLVDEGAELSRIFVLLTDLYNQRFRFVHSITKKQGTLVMAITHSFHDIRVDINDIWLN